MSGSTSPENRTGNRLATASSSYLRSAAHQPVDWQEWGEAAFGRAQAEDKPVLLDIGAVWCHWCHVMDRESYEDSQVAVAINQNFVAIKVDRDERPEVDTRYQAAVNAIAGQGGWPLTVFLAPDGRPYFGGTYIPREDGYGRAGILRVLEAMARVWRENRAEALETAGSLMAAIERNETLSLRGRLRPELLERLAAGMMARYDARNGGFGTEPKFPHPPAMDFLLERALGHGDRRAEEAFLATLEVMRRGGVYDQLAGGFHRYSVDERWRVPHFEKMLYDNTELLRNYVHGYQSFVREEFAQTAREIVDWLDREMSDRERGGFYASQDADVGLEDDGDFFTWTLEEVRAALDEEEFAFACEHWGVRAQGEMHHNSAKNVLHVARTLEAMAEGDEERLMGLRGLRERVRAHLLAARLRRQQPGIDRTLYTGWNALAVSAYLDAACVLRMEAACGFALKTLDRLLAEAWDGGLELRHVMAYADGSAPAQVRSGVLEDYAATIHAALDGWMASGEMRYYRAAVKLADAAIAQFYDGEGGGFYDVAAEDGARLGALAARRKPVEDTPTPAGNPTMASALLRLEALRGGGEYARIAADTLENFAGAAEHFGLLMGSYALAAERLLGAPVEVAIVGAGAAAARLEAVAVARYSVHKTVLRIAPERLSPEKLPEALAERLVSVPASPAEAWALVCKGRTCLPPVTRPEELLEALAG